MFFNKLIILSINSFSFASILKDLNDNYSSLLSTISSFLILIVTIIYVIFTFKLVIISQKTINNQIDFFEKSKVPLVIIQFNKNEGSKLTNYNRRFLNFNILLKNIGDTSCLEIYGKLYLILKYSNENLNNNDPKEYINHTYLEINEEKVIEVCFEKEIINVMLNDLSINYDKNMERIFKNPKQNAFEGPLIKVVLYYKNIYNKFFKSELIAGISYVIATKRKGINKLIYINGNNKNELKDNEPFSIILDNPGLHRINFNIIDENEYMEFYNKYKNVVSKN